MIPRLQRALLSASRAITGETSRALRNPEWNDAEARILIVRLSPIRDVDRSSSHQIIYAQTREALPKAYIDFAFFPDRSDRDLIATFEGLNRDGSADKGNPVTRARWPWFFGAASGKSPIQFDLILVSNAFGLELVNLPRLFSTAGIPLRASARREAPGHMPIVLLGGSNAGQAAAIVEDSGDSLVDGIFFGEGEGAIGPLARILSERGRGREERILAAASVEGFWPSLHPEMRARRRILRASPPPLLFWPPFDTPEATTARLQITAGCPGYCSFCFEGWDRRPYRELPFEALLLAAREMKARNGVETLEVYSFNFNTHAEIFKILFELGRIFKNVNLMSQRLDILASTPGLVRAELAAGKRSFTLGVEGISSRMRAFYRKGLDDDALDRLVELLVSPEVREIKLFYILAGFEDGDDLVEFSAFATRLAERKREFAPGIRLLASAGYLVRLPGTPLGHAPLILDEGTFAPIARRLGSLCEASGIEWRLAVHFDEFCVDQIVSLAGGRLLPWFESLSEKGPAFVYDGSLGKEVWPDLEGYARSHNLFDSGFLEEKGPEATPLFPFLEKDREAPVLHREYLAAKAFIDRTKCLGGSCVDCGACPDIESKLLLTRHRILPQEREGNRRLERLVSAKGGFAKILVEIERPESLGGASIVAQEAWLLGRFCAIGAEAPKAIFSARLVSPREGGNFGVAPGSTGWSIFELEGPSAKALVSLAETGGLRPIAAAEEPAELAVSLQLPDGFAAMVSSLTGRDHGQGETEAQEGGKFARSLVAEWLADSRLASTERREGGIWRFEIATKDLAKRSVLSASVEGGRIDLLIGPKARLGRLGTSLNPRLAAFIAGQIRLGGRSRPSD